MAKEIVKDLNGGYHYYKDLQVLAELLRGKIGQAQPNETATEVANAIVANWQGAKYYNDPAILAQCGGPPVRAVPTAEVTRQSEENEMLRFIVLLTVSAVVSGCASTVATFFNRPVVEDSVEEAVSTVSLAADRRTVVVVTEGTNRTKFCAEPPPDTATGLKTELDASLEAKAAKADIEGKFGLKDKLDTTVVVIAERTAALDAFRTGVYALCQYHLNGAIPNEHVRPLFEKLIKAFVSSQPKSPEKVGQ